MARRKTEQPVEETRETLVVARYAIRLDVEPGTTEVRMGASEVDDRLFEFLSYLQLPKGFKIVVDRQKEIT